MNEALNPGRANAGETEVRRKVLVVDDNAGNLLAMTLILKRGNIDARSAEDGEAAIELLSREAFDALLSDVDMPNMSGFELLEWARKNRPEMPVLLMSGSVSGATGQTMRRALEKGARAVLAKPFVKGELERAIAEILR